MDHGGSRQIAIEEHCKNCYGSTNASQCPFCDCGFFPFRPGANDPGAVQRRPGDVPSVEEYEAMIEAADPDGTKRAKRIECMQATLARQAGMESDADSDDDDLDV